MDQASLGERSWAIMSAVSHDTGFSGPLRRLEQDPPNWSRIAFAMLEEVVGRIPPSDRFGYYGAVGFWCLAIALFVGWLAWALEIQGRRRVIAASWVLLLMVVGATFWSRWLGIRLTMRARRREVADAVAGLEADEVHEGEGFYRATEAAPSALVPAAGAARAPHVTPASDPAVDELRRQNEAH